ncbi:MAG: LysR family transcriptional regulator, partial [Gammaproteobacteria bacterium]|nr:LysR family transcriptional regulator [Gammaproteobacteria bacterium]
MSLALRHIRAFAEVARQGSFRRAAEKLFVSQPALTITISQLEELVGVSLFNRTT